MRASKRASERRLGGSSQEPPEPECHKHDPSDRTCFLLYKLRAWVHFAGRHIQPAQPSRTRRTTGWQACTTATTEVISKKNIIFNLKVARSFTYAFARSLTYAFIHSLTHLLTYSLTHLLAHLLTHTHELQERTVA